MTPANLTGYCGLRLEDVLDSDALAEVERAQAEAEAAAPSRMSDQAARARALDVEDLRGLADRARRGERVSLKKTGASRSSSE